ncbi:MAG: GTP pyrophosphokinase [Acutalibacteraceae bacterium]|nr:GTP pyrophosphokinase [Acutalibacteraceae bacterium]
MIYTPLTKKALKISFNAHKDQVDKSGMPYVYHPFHLAEQMNDEYSTCVALLHDVVEDTDISLDDLTSEGFPAEVIDALTLMTHDDKVPYMDYVRKIKTNPIATKVKLADLEHNSDLSRLDLVDDVAWNAQTNTVGQLVFCVMEKQLNPLQRLSGHGIRRVAVSMFR